MTNKERLLEILEETKDFYLEDPERIAYVGGEGCVYLTDDGRKCAVGRMLTPEGLKFAIEEKAGGVYSLFRLVKEHQETTGQNFECFKPEYQGLSKDFLCKLQEFHDYHLTNLESKHPKAKLKASGENFYNILKQKIQNGRLYS